MLMRKNVTEQGLLLLLLNTAEKGSILVTEKYMNRLSLQTCAIV
jgi:hypothetical protein